MQDYNYVWGQCFEITLELSCCKYPPADQLEKFWRDNKVALIEYIKQVHLGGYANGGGRYKLKPGWWAKRETSTAWVCVRAHRWGVLMWTWEPSLLNSKSDKARAGSGRRTYRGVRCGVMDTFTWCKGLKMHWAGARDRPWGPPYHTPPQGARFPEQP